MPHSPQADRDYRELQAYTLTMDIVNRLFAASFEVDQAIRSDPRAKSAVDDAEAKDEDGPIDQLTRSLAASNRSVAIAAAHGFTPRALAIAQLSLIQTAIALAAISNGTTLDRAVKDFNTSPANVRLLQQHAAELDALKKKYPIPDAQ